VRERVLNNSSAHLAAAQQASPRNVFSNVLDVSVKFATSYLGLFAWSRSIEDVLESLQTDVEYFALEGEREPALERQNKSI
jgi:hypothetical protein